MSSDGGHRLVTLRLAARSAHARPVRWLIGVGVTAFALGLGGVPLGPPLGVLLVLVLAVSMAGAPEPDDVRADSVLHLVGARRRHRYGLVVWSALLVLVPGVFVGLVACAAGGALGLTTLPNSWFLLILVGAGVAVTPLAARRRLSAQDGSTGGSRHRPTQAIDAVLLAVGALLIGAAAALPRISRTGLDLSLSLFFAYVGVSVGLFMAMPVLVRVPRWLLSHLHFPPSRMAAGRPLPGIALSIWLVALGTTVVVSTSIVGFGLVDREHARQLSLRRFDLRHGTTDDQLIVRANINLLGKHALTLDPKLTGALRREPGLSSVATIDVPANGAGSSHGTADQIVSPSLRVVSGALGPVGDDSVGVATPDVVAALHLNGAQRFLDRGGALLLDPTRIEGGRVTVRTFGTFSPSGSDGASSAGRTFHLPARVVTGRRVAAELPAVLVAPAVVARMSSDPVRPVVAIARAPGLSVDARDELKGRLTRADPPPAPYLSTAGSLMYRVDVDSGGGGVDARELRRTDAPGVALVRDERSLVVVLIAALLAYAVVVLVGNAFVALSRRQEDQMLEVLGAPPSLVSRIAAMQAAAVALVGVVVGSLIGFLGTASGIAAYNHSTRLGGDSPALPALPFTIPIPLVLALVALPAVSAGTAAVAVLRRPPVDPTLLGERLVAYLPQ